MQARLSGQRISSRPMTPDQDHVDRNNEVEQARDDQDENASNQRDNELRMSDADDMTVSF